MRTTGKRVSVGFALLVVATFAGATLVAASIPDANNVIYGCYQLDGGALRVIDTENPSEAGCIHGVEGPLNWNQQGPVGPVGPSGPQGPAGPVGPAGPAGVDGVSGHEKVTALTPSSSQIQQGQAASCPHGKVVVGGGATIKYKDDKGARTVALITSSPTTHHPVLADGWLAQAREITPTASTWWLEVTALCASVS